MRTLQFTTTHVAQRPDILRRTIESFQSNLIDIDFSNSKIFINIDFAPDYPNLEDGSDKTIDFLNSVFGEVVFNKTEEPNFTRAIQWCWNSVEDEIFFHLEDDWVLEEKVSIEEIMPYFNNKNVFAVNLRAYKFAGPRACLLPALYRKSFCRKFVEKLDYYRNPENQLRSYVKVNKDFFNIHYPEDIHDIILKDIGREWLRHKGLKRNQISTKFIRYSRDITGNER